MVVCIVGGRIDFVVGGSIPDRLFSYMHGGLSSIGGEGVG